MLDVLGILGSGSLKHCRVDKTLPSPLHVISILSVVWHISKCNIYGVKLSLPICM